MKRPYRPRIFFQLSQACRPGLLETAFQAEDRKMKQHAPREDYTSELIALPLFNEPDISELHRVAVILEHYWTGG
jgi:hypothetical protein